MKILKVIGIVILALIAIVLIVAAVAPKDFSVQRSVSVNKPKSEVFGYVKYLKNQDSYSVWAQRDPNMKREFRGEDGTVGFVSVWDGNREVGKGEQEIKGITEGEKIDFELRFKEPMENTAASYMSTETEGENATKVTWGISGKSPYPFNIMHLFMDMDKMLGSDLQAGLDKMKANVEAMPSPTVVAQTDAPVIVDSTTQTQAQ
jgi:hypothetical protein